ncbi:MAG: site-specific tyrosine recombinase/integron integrase [Paraclostridium sp.]
MNDKKQLTTNFIIKLSKSINLNYEQQQIVISIFEECIGEYDLSKKELVIVESDIQEKILLYLQTKKLQGLSEKTLQNYFYLLRKFTVAFNKCVADITINDLRAFIVSETTGLKQTTINTKIMYIQSFFKWLHEEEYIDKDPSIKLPIVKTPKRLRNSLTLEEVERLRLACTTYREKALIEILIATGCRVSEVSGMNKEDLNLHENTIRVIGKGDKERIVFFNEKTRVHLNNYLKERNDDIAALFTATRKPFNRLGPRTLQKEINQIAKKAKFDKSVFPHLFRHTFATHGLRNGASLITIQNLLGHCNIATTEKYISTSVDNVRHEYKQHMIQ